jgi:hypothetical protein
MKKIYKLFLVTVFITGALFQSCETLELEQINNPNNLTSGDANFFLNRVQNEYRSSQAIFNDRSSDMTRIDYMFGRNYFTNYGAGNLNGVWGNLYSDMLPDIQAIEALEDETTDLSYHIGISKIMTAHMLMELVDLLGDIVPLSQATQPIEFPTPELTNDGGASVYASALNLLDEAITLLNLDPPTTGVQDLFYGGDATKWIKAANTFKMRAAMTTGDAAGFNAIVSGGNFISSSDDDFQFNYGTQLAPVNTQHPDYQNDYTSSGANIYQNTWLMDLMLDNDDPRRRYYFFRQNACTPGATCDPAGDGESLQCSLQSIPTHLQGSECGDLWCFMEDGYWGRMHGDDDGTPPDNFLRTAAGVYPASGKFDDDDFSGVFLGAGGNGAGIEPIVLASYVDFWRAEMALAQGSTMANTHFENGLTKSIAKVQSFISLDGDADMAFVPTNVSTYITDMTTAFSSSTGDAKWNILAEQYFVTLYGGGSDARSFYLRTGYPTTLCPSIDPNPGNFPRTLLYPSNEVGSNPNITQRTNNDAAVFWNTQALPASN